jgi:hypothetical protein
MVRDLETRVTQPPSVGATCTVPGRPSNNAFESNPDNKAGFDLLAYALSCDLTRVATLGWQECCYGYLGVKGSYHDDYLHHVLDGGVAQSWVHKIKTYETGLVAYLCDKLKSIPEGGGTLFDNTLVVWCDEFCHGYEHKHHEIPYVLLSGSDRFFKMGRFLDFGPGGASNNQLWLSIRDAMGVTGDFGDPQFGSTPLSRLA